MYNFAKTAIVFSSFVTVFILRLRLVTLKLSVSRD